MAEEHVEAMARGFIQGLQRKKRDFLAITVADFIVRAAYQMGKTPLLPIFAAALGASDVFLGLIVSVSTLTGMLLKPLIGLLSDRWGRRIWLLVGTLFFALMPFVYVFIQNPEQLFFVRIVHGLATAIYGPVTLAYIAATKDHLAEKLGWFGMARSGGYVVGPALAGVLLLYLSPALVFTFIGLLSSLAFLPIVSLSEPEAPRSHTPSFKEQVHGALETCRQSRSIWLSGLLESLNYIVIYALKAFLPIYALSIGINVVVVGLFFSFQEAINMLLKPFTGRLADRMGYLCVISLGMLVLAVSVWFVAQVETRAYLLAIAALMGAAQAIIFPAILALVSQQVDPANLGFSLGLVGSLRNAGKVAGPVLAGGLIAVWGHQISFQVLSVALGMMAVFIALAILQPRFKIGKPLFKPLEKGGD